MAVLCLAGCSKDEPQSVSFSEEVCNISYKGGDVIVNIVANCPWIMSGNLRFAPASGNGNTSVIIKAEPNQLYDKIQHRITVNSEDGSSSDILTVCQDANIGLELGKAEMISEEGGSFTINVNTNDEIIEVDTPDWITYTSSRALTQYDYIFTAEPNKTGSVRNGIITIKGKELTKDITIEQDSYAPTGFVFESPMAFTTNGEIAVGFKMEPEYADPSKFKVKTYNSDCVARVKNNTLYGTVTKEPYYEYPSIIFAYGVYPIYFVVNEETISSIELVYMPKYPLDIQNEMYIGQTLPLKLTDPAGVLTPISSDTSVLEIAGNTIHSVGEGTASVSVDYPNLDIHQEVKITSKPVVVEAVIHSTVDSPLGGFYDRINFKAQIGCKYEPEVLMCLILNNESKVIGRGFTQHKNKRFFLTEPIDVYWYGYNSFSDAIEGYKLWLNIRMNDKIYEMKIPINTRTDTFVYEL